MGKDGLARVWYVASMMMLLTGDSCRATKHLSPFGGKAAPSVQHRELQDSCGDCGTEIFLEDDDAEMSCTTCNEVLIACMEDYGESDTGSGGFGICHPCGDLSVDEVIQFYEGICGDPLSSITEEYISGCLYYVVPPECPSDVTSSDDDDTSESSDDSSTDDDESSDDYPTDDDESSDDYPTDDDSNISPVPSPSTDDDPITPPTTTEGNGGRIRACGSVGALAVAVVNVVFLLTEMR
ncbi:imm upregulated 12 [Ectocarpus siliculosus]|uniref:Imm upregulated 12 n=1 Tax=Ectocarpus siliculosus TaxID=2880 RepID=D7FX41_ECTSI|nr:imm upregulated 12 [Ectocarpus siliculosus]|eukprot:CBJ26374.1 imm upregulated 12 [Ectocarpus siliculosus]